MMKKLLSIALILAVLLTLPALAAEGDVLVYRGQSDVLSEFEGISSYCAVGDTLYMFAGSGKNTRVLVHKVGQASPEVYNIDIPEQDGYSRSVRYTLFSDGESPMALEVTSNYDGETRTETAVLCKLVLADGKASFEEIRALDWDIMKGEDGYFYYMQQAVALKDCLIITTYDERGMFLLIKLNYADGTMERIEMEGVDYLNSIAAYTDGKAIFPLTDYEKDLAEYKLMTFDPATGSMEELVKIDNNGERYLNFNGVCADPQTGAVYCVKDGEVCSIDLTTGIIGEGIASIPMDVYGDSVVYVLDGGYFAYATYEGYIIRNLNPTEKAPQKLTVMDYSYSNGIKKAFYTFLNEHGDTEAVLSHDYSGTLVDKMMNRDSSVDIYVISSSSSDYRALLNRGYIAEMDGEEFDDLAQHLRGLVASDIVINGKLCALPVEGYIWQTRINQKALEKLGMTMDDIPRNWMDFMDFLMDLPSKLPQDGSVKLFDPYTSDTYARRSLFDVIFKTYQTLLEHDPDKADANTMVQILEKLERVDFRALGQPPEEETRDENFNPEYSEDGYLLTTNTGSQLAGITQYNDVPILMSLTADTPTYLTLDAQVAFINPFTENMDGAMDFMRLLCGSLDESIEYTLRDDRSDPTPNPYYEENIANAEEYVANIQARLDAAEEMDKQSIEEELRYAQEYLEQTKEARWSISEADIAWLDANQDGLMLASPEWLYSEDSGEAHELIEQYCQGTMDAKRLMNAIDKKIRMMIMEGN